ncbi:MAG: hypothetical protein ABIP94_08350 [Planctomycetota bacterium]
MRTRTSFAPTLLLAALPLTQQATAQITVNPNDRAAVVNLFNNIYSPARGNSNHGWTGSVAGCVPGTLNAQFVTDSLTALNVFRAMTGMLSVTFGNPTSFPTSGSGNVDCQQGALMLHAAGTLSHNLPANSPCFTAAGNAALGTSNLSSGLVGPGGMELLIDDGNGDLGHRRWMLHEPQLQMAMGATSTFMALDVQGPNSTGPRTRFSAWPPAGFVPYPWAYSSWSFAVPGVNQSPFNPATQANYTNATVSVTRAGNPVPIVTRIPGQCIFCYDNAIAWTFNPPLTVGGGMNDTPYVVTISNVANTAQSTYTYTVTLIDAGAGTPDECAGATPLANGVNGPYSNAAATTSPPAWPCGTGSKDLWFSYTATGAGTLTASTCGLANFDTVMQVFSGPCGALVSLACNDDDPACNLQSTISVPVTPGTYRLRVGGFNGSSGSFSINVTGPQGGAPATVTSYGTGCYVASRAFYELFASAAFDLDNTSMRLVRTGSVYTAQAAGSFVAPTGAATVLALGDDAFTTVNLSTPFPYIGGSTSTLEVCSNGFVSAATGNGFPTTPTSAVWLGSAAIRWGTWHDFDPSPAASGKVKFQQIGAVAYVTWDGVFDYNTTTGNRWQLQFDSTTGNVTYAWQTMSHLGNALLVGYAPAGPNNDPGNRDISASLPTTFVTSSQNMPPPALNSTLPTLGTSAALTTTSYPITSTIGLMVESLVQQNPGIDLTAVGMPGCRLFLNLDVTSTLLLNGGPSVFMQAIPNMNSLIGVRIFAQSFVFVPGANALGLIASNGVILTIGL